MIVHTNIEKYTILYTIMHGPQICTINKRLVFSEKITQVRRSVQPLIEKAIGEEKGMV